MSTIFQNYIHRKISDAVDTGKPLPVHLEWVVKHNKSARDFYKNLLHLKNQLVDDLPQFLNVDPKTCVLGKHEYSSKKTAVWSKLAVAVVLLLGLSIYGLIAYKNTENSEQIAVIQGPITEPADDTGQVSKEIAYSTENLYLIVQPLRESIPLVPHSMETVVPDSLKIVEIDWNESKLKLNPVAIELITEHSKEMFNQLPLVESTFAFAARVSNEFRDIEGDEKTRQ